MLDIENPDKVGLPLITTLHHPITFDRRIDLSQTKNPWRKLTLSRWYGFLRMQGKVARQARKIMTPSETSKRDIAKDFGVDPAKMEVILLGVDDGFVPPTTPRVPGRIMAMASADAPMKGVATLLEAFAKLRTERDVELILVTKPQAGGRTEKLIEKLSIGDSVRFAHGLSEDELVALMGSAEVACVPSLYEGFSLPTAELMACATPLVVSRAGAIPEVVGPDGLCADLVTPGDVGELFGALERMLDDPERRDRMGAAGRVRVQELFSWRAVAAKVAAAYEETIAEYKQERRMLTVDFDRLGLRPGDRVLDMGCGAGRHAFEVYRRGGDVVAFDMDADELAGVLELFGAMKEAGEVPEGAEADIKQGDALQLPFADGEFDRIVAAEVLEHIHADVDAIKELVRVLRPGGTMAISVPRWLPEVINWKLSDDYHNAEGGHIRIYTDHELIDKVTKAGRFNDGTPGDAMEYVGKDYAHGLHAPYWWIKCAVGVNNDDHPLAKAYHKLLVWEIMKQPKTLQLAGKVLDPMIGKSMVLYFRKPEAA